MKKIIILLGILIALTSCNPDTTRMIGEPQAFLVKMSEPMDIQTTLDSSNYLIISSVGDTIPIGNVKFVSQALENNVWIQAPFNSWIAIYPAHQIFSGAYVIEIYDLEDEAGNVIQDNPTRIKVKYEPKWMRVE